VQPVEQQEKPGIDMVERFEQNRFFSGCLLGLIFETFRKSQMAIKQITNKILYQKIQKRKPLSVFEICLLRFICHLGLCIL
jgi:hypothetical protein